MNSNLRRSGLERTSINTTGSRTSANYQLNQNRSSLKEGGSKAIDCTQFSKIGRQQV